MRFVRIKGKARKKVKQNNRAITGLSKLSPFRGGSSYPMLHATTSPARYDRDKDSIGINGFCFGLEKRERARQSDREKKNVFFQIFDTLQAAFLLFWVKGSVKNNEHYRFRYAFGMLFFFFAARLPFTVARFIFVFPIYIYNSRNDVLSKTNFDFGTLRPSSGTRWIQKNEANATSQLVWNKKNDW